MAWRVLAMAALAVAASGLVRGDLKQARAEANLEKRSKLALENAGAMLQDAREAYQKGDNNRVEADVAEMRESVDLAYQSLVATNKDPRRSPRWFKYAEIQTRDMLRRLDSFEQNMSYSDRPVLADVKAFVQQVHDKLLLGLMEGKPK